VNFGALTVLYLGIARDLHAHARDDLRFRSPLLLALPVLLGAIGYGSRAVQALAVPGSVLTDMATHSALNVGSALSFVVLVLMLHATLMTLLVARLVRQLQRLSRHDGLTGLLNRRAIQGALEEQHERSLRAGEPFAVLMIDLDHFKAVNDRFGHATGDQALKVASSLLHRRLADQGWVGRFGGEEFIALLPGYRLDKAVEMAEELRVALSAERPAQLPPDLPLSVSIGVAQWSGPDEALTRLLVRADEAMYEAKRRGRDRVVAADQ
jgi:diguanylate cyclase (GGDEF)-like protein